MLSILQKPKINKKIRMRLLEIDGEKIDVKIIEDKRASRLTLSLMPKAQRAEQLRVSVPPRTPLYEIDDFLDKSKHWAAVRLAKLPKIVPIKHGEKIPLRGVQHKIIHQQGRGIVEAVETQSEKIIKVFGNECFIKRKVQDFLKKEAKHDLQKAVFHYANLLEVKPKSITLRDSKTRWGSCSSEGALNFSWRIIFAPPPVLQYLAAHEVAHLLEMNHSNKFWRLVEKICPDYERQKIWLRKHGTKLHCLAAS